MDKQIKAIMVYYIDVGNLAPFEAEALIERTKDSLNKDGLLTRLQEQGYEIICIPVRPNSQTRIEVVPCIESRIPITSHHHCPEEDDLECKK